MPQQKFRVETADGKVFEVEVPGAEPSIGDRVGGFAGGFKDEYKDTGLGLLETMKSAGRQIMAGNMGDLVPSMAREAAVMQAASGQEFDPATLDPTGIAPIVKSDEPFDRKLGRGAAVLSMAAIPFMRRAKGGKVPTPKAGPPRSLATKTGTSFSIPPTTVIPEQVRPGLSAPAVPMAPPIATSTSKGTTRMMPGSELPAIETPPVTTPRITINGIPTAPSGGIITRMAAPRVTSGTSAQAAGVSVPAPTSPRGFSMSVPAAGGDDAAHMATGTAEPLAAQMSDDAAAQAARNAALKAELEAEVARAGKTEAPGRPPAYEGPERRQDPNRMRGAAADRAFREVRRRLEEAEIRKRARAMLTGSKKKEGKSGGQPKAGSAAPAATTPATFESLSQRIGEIEARVSKDANIPDAEWEKLTKELFELREARAAQFPDELAARTSALDASTKKATGDALSGRTTPLADNPPKASAAPDPSAPKSWAGFTRQPTKTLAQMVEEYGKEGAAQRAGMEVRELEVRLQAGQDPAALAKLMRQEFGSEKAARLLGENRDKLKASGPSRLPKEAVDRIKKAAERELAENGAVSEKTQALLDRIQREQEAGFTRLGGLLVGGGAALGGVAAATGPAKDSNERLGNTLIGAAGGAALGAAPQIRLKQAFRVANALRREAFLTGGAIPKNLLTSASAPVRAAFEGHGTKPMKEMYNPIKNAAVFAKAVRRPPVPKPGEIHFGRLSPSAIIGAIDDTARQALERGGVPTEAIERFLLTKDRNVFAGMKMDPRAKEVVDVLYPFQRVPTNVFAEGMGELAHTIFATPDGRTALNLMQMGGGYALGKWASNDPKKQYIASILLAAAGPNALLTTAATAYGAGARGFKASAFGGISPIPEQALDPKSLIGVKPAGVSMIQRLTK